MTTTPLFLDDERHPDWLATQSHRQLKAGTDWVIVRTVEAAKTHILRHGLPTLISFDNDLGQDAPGGDGVNLMRWLIEQHVSGVMNLDHCELQVHSMNPVEAQRMQRLAAERPAFGAYCNLPDPWDNRMNFTSSRWAGILTDLLFNHWTRDGNGRFQQLPAITAQAALKTLSDRYPAHQYVLDPEALLILAEQLRGRGWKRSLEWVEELARGE